MRLSGPSVGLRQTQRQSLAMTPALQQSIKLLQLPTAELETVLRDALEANPLLEMEELPETDAPPPQRPRPRPGHGFGPVAGLAAAIAGGTRTGGGAGEAARDYAVPAASNPHEEALLEEIAFEFTDERPRSIANCLVAALDDAGYLAAGIDDIADACGCPSDQVEPVLSRLQTLCGSGLFARDLRECLMIQLNERGRLSGSMKILLDNLEDVADRRIDRLAQTCGVDAEAIEAMIGEIRTLDPRPGAQFDGALSPSVAPDLIVTPWSPERRLEPETSVRVGDWIVQLNPETAPVVRVDDRSFERLMQESRSGDDRAYLRDQKRSARWLARALQHRAAAILKIGAAIVARQSAFLESGIEGFQPLTQVEAAEAAEVHESTVSRAARGKYLASPAGTFELAFFFSPAIPDAHGGSPHSARVVRHRLHRLVDAEQAPLSDDALADALRDQGFVVARRTVAKYRELLGIPSSVARRRKGRAGAMSAAGVDSNLARH